jgi:pimeloyl-ACP methyl ester carboxylesterase
MKHTLVFIHGLESTSLGTKAQYFRKLFPDMIIEDYTGDFQTRMIKLRHILEGKDNLILVGSSYGGLMAAQYAVENEERVKKLILIAPALTLEEFETDASRPLNVPVIIYHGRKDDVVDPTLVKAIADKTFRNLSHYLVDDDHPLNQVFPTIDWPRLLEQDDS